MLPVLILLTFCNAFSDITRLSALYTSLGKGGLVFSRTRIPSTSAEQSETDIVPESPTSINAALRHPTEVSMTPFARFLLSSCLESQEEDASEMEVDHLVGKTPISTVLAVEQPVGPFQKRIQLITDEMTRLFQEPPYKTTDNVPDAIHLHMNAVGPRKRQLANARGIFEAQIAQAEDPRAPPIKIYNPIDKEPCPAFEFVYSNEMWYDTEIGAPNYKDIKGCDCVGGCENNSTTCACLARQEYWTNDPREEGHEGFAYADDGTLLDRSYPVFECNWKCGCDETCRNRVSVVQPLPLPLPVHLLRLYKMDAGASSTLSRPRRKAGVCVHHPLKGLRFMHVLHRRFLRI
jgi:hypothetical protein